MFLYEWIINSLAAGVRPGSRKSLGLNRVDTLGHSRVYSEYNVLLEIDFSLFFTYRTYVQSYIISTSFRALNIRTDIFFALTLKLRHCNKPNSTTKLSLIEAILRNFATYRNPDTEISSITRNTSKKRVLRALSQHAPICRGSRNSVHIQLSHVPYIVTIKGSLLFDSIWPCSTSKPVSFRTAWWMAIAAVR